MLYSRFIDESVRNAPKATTTSTSTPTAVASVIQALDYQIHLASAHLTYEGNSLNDKRNAARLGLAYLKVQIGDIQCSNEEDSFGDLIEIKENDGLNPDMDMDMDVEMNLDEGSDEKEETDVMIKMHGIKVILPSSTTAFGIIQAEIETNLSGRVTLLPASSNHKLVSRPESVFAGSNERVLVQTTFRGSVEGDSLMDVFVEFTGARSTKVIRVSCEVLQSPIVWPHETRLQINAVDNGAALTQLYGLLSALGFVKMKDVYVTDSCKVAVTPSMDVHATGLTADDILSLVTRLVQTFPQIDIV